MDGMGHHFFVVVSLTFTVATLAYGTRLVVVGIVLLGTARAAPCLHVNWVFIRLIAGRTWWSAFR